MVKSSKILDPIEMEVFTNRLLSITNDMGNILIRSSFSTNIKERKDCSTALFDKNGRCIAQAAHMPMHLGSLLGSVRAVRKYFTNNKINDGDVFICNDPYLAQGTHMPDITIVTPIFINKNLEFFATNVGHHSDVGGSVPGSISNKAKSIFEEGIRIPPLKIKKKGKLNQDLFDIIITNTREPEERKLDLNVQIATNEKAKFLIFDLVKNTSLKAINRSIEDVLNYTNLRIKKQFRTLKKGEFSFTRFMDHDGYGGSKIKINVKIKVKSEKIILDFSNSSKQSRGGLNLPSNGLEATCYYAIKSLIDPEIMPNSGYYDTIKIITKKGTITDPFFPAAVGSRAITANKVAGAIFGAMSSMVNNNRGMASSSDTVPAIVLSSKGKSDNDTYVYMETIGGGHGAMYNSDGMDATHVHTSNTSNLPAEALEVEYPLVVEEYSLVNNSGGSGEFRGGLGIARQIKTLKNDTIFTVRADSHKFGAPGLFEGKEGDKAKLYLNYKTKKEKILSSNTSYLIINRNDSIRMETPGGGGYGKPSKRDIKKIFEDLNNQKITKNKIKNDFGEKIFRKVINYKN